MNEHFKRMHKSPHVRDIQQRPSISEVFPGLFIGNERSMHGRSTLENNHITTVVSLVVGRHVLWRREQFTDYIKPDHHLWIECLDSSTQDLLVYMDQICDFIDKMLCPAQGFRSDQASLQSREVDGDPVLPSGLPNGVLVHCELGISRSPTIVIAYLMRKQHKSRDEVLSQVRKQRSRVKPSQNLMEQLGIWEEVGYRLWEDEKREKPKAPYAAFLEKRAAALKEKGLTGNEPLGPLTL